MITTFENTLLLLINVGQLHAEGATKLGFQTVWILMIFVTAVTVKLV